MNEKEQLEKHFKSIGAEVRFLGVPMPRFNSDRVADRFEIDVRPASSGRERFIIRKGPKAPALQVLQVKPKDKHLLLYSRDGQRFLCGHDERHWFVAGIEGRVSTVDGAKRSLVPEGLRSRVHGVKSKVTNKRKNRIYRRQGEWFFVPVYNSPNSMVFQNEPLQRRAGSKPHMCQELKRSGGRVVYTLGSKIYELSEDRKMREENPHVYRLASRRIADAVVYVRGWIRHEDHSTVVLDGWHQVYLNGEPFTGSVTFLD